jgi:hypothetical protein
VRSLRLAPLVLTAALLPACSASVGEATLRPVCTPRDAAATGLVVSYTARDYPQLRFRFAGPVGSLAGREIEISGSGGAEASAQWCSSDRNCRPPQDASVVFDSLARDSTMLVLVQASVPAVGWMGSQLFARWHGETLACG